MGAAALPVNHPPKAARLGWPLTTVPEYPALASSGHEDTDPDELLEAEYVPCVLLASTGHTILCVCPVCQERLVSGMALFQHVMCTQTVNLTPVMIVIILSII